jgi:iron uptake system component EfeO
VAFNTPVIRVRRPGRRISVGVARSAARQCAIALACTAVLVMALAACVQKSDAEFRREVAASMHSSITQDLANIVQAARDLQTAAPTRAWSAQTDAAAIMRMQEAWMRMRMAWEHVEGAVAPMFAGLNQTMDARYEDYLADIGRRGDQYLFDDEGVIGMHAIERILFATNIRSEVVRFESQLSGYVPASYPSTDNEAIAFKTQLVQRLIDDANELASSWRPEDVDIEAAYHGLIDLMSEQQEKVSLAATGEEESRYSNVTLFDLRNNLTGTNQVYGLFREWIRAKSAESSDDNIQTKFTSLKRAYSSPDSDSLPQAPDGWSSENPTPDALRTPFGSLWLQIHEVVDPNRPESVVSEMNRISALLGFTPDIGTKRHPGAGPMGRSHQPSDHSRR